MKKRNVLVITLVFLMSFFFISPSNTVMAIPQARTIDSWESYTVGQTSGTGAYGTWEATADADVEVSDAWSYSGSKSWRANPAGAGGGTQDYNAFYNMTWDFPYISQVKIWFNYPGGATGANNIDQNIFYLYNDSQEVNYFYTVRGIGINEQSRVYIMDYDSATYILEDVALGANHERQMIITHVSLNTFNYSLYHPGNETYIHGLDISGRNAFTHTTYDQLRWRHYILGATGGLTTCYVDNIVFTEDELPAGEGEGDEGNIYIKVYDSLSGEQMHMQGSNINDATKEDRIWPKIECDLWIGEYDPDMSGYMITITGDFDEGSTHDLYFNGFYDNNIVGYLNGVTKNWWEFNATFKWYKETVYSFTLTSTDAGAPGYVYCVQPTVWPSTEPCMNDPSKLTMCLQSDTYSFGETIKMKFYFPSKSWLANNGGFLWGDMSEGWRIELWDESEWSSDPIEHWTEGEGYWNAPPDCDYVYFEIVCDDLWNFADEYRQYKFQLVNREPWVDFTAGEIYFWVTGETVNLEADLLYINPATPMTFQGATIAWTSNCTVKIEIERLGSGDDPDVYYSGNINGTSYLNVTFWQTGEYLASIYGYDGIGMNPIPLDTLQFDVTGEYNPWPGHEYLEIFGDPNFIAGQPGRNVTINFKTLIDEANLTILMPNGATSWFSRTVNITDRSHSFWLPPGAPIGEWTVTLYAQATHVNYFHVISEEGNFLKFVKNTYYDDEWFSIIIKHTRYVSLTFYKDGIPQGQDWLLGIDDHAKELNGIVVPPAIARPAVGSWSVEMWRLNEENIQSFLASDNCTVIHRPDTPVTPGDSELGNLVQNAFPDPTVRTIIGLVICLVITLLPYLVALKIKERHVTINIPTILYGVCFGIGVAVNYILGFFGFEVMFFITFIVISIMAFMYLYGKKSASSGTEA